MKILSITDAERKQIWLKDKFDISHFYQLFSSSIVTVKGLTNCFYTCINIVLFTVSEHSLFQCHSTQHILNQQT